MAQIEQDQLMTSAEAAQYLSLSRRTLENWRHRLVGPPYRKLGNAVRYKASELAQWVDESSQVGAP